jgi:4-hydroxy-L-threonine phosphate dehydrogenase PdxA
MPSNHKPILAITMGDPTGIGPEIIAGALENPLVTQTCIPQWLLVARASCVVQARSSALGHRGLLVRIGIKSDRTWI